MKNFDLSTSTGLKGFLNNLKRAFVDADMDIRQTKISKVLHRAADAFDMGNWTDLADELDNRKHAGTYELCSQKRDAAESVMTDLLTLSNAIENGDYSEDLDDSIYGNAVESVRMHYSLGSDRSIYFNVLLSEGRYSDVESALIEVRGWGTRGYREATTDELSKLVQLFEGRIMNDLEGSRFGESA